jgi:LysM repeat protein
VADNHQYIVNIKNDGWATDSRYIDTLDSIVPAVRETINEFGVWLASQAQSPTQNQPQTEPQTQGRTYRVVAGDTLSQIAKRFGVPMSQLVELNHIQNPNMIRVGQVLTIDRVGAPTYVVQKGDNLTKIALAHHTSVERLVQLNHISNPNLIRVGQKLLV